MGWESYGHDCGRDRGFPNDTSDFIGTFVVVIFCFVLPLMYLIHMVVE
jgi:hypothetical protein